MKVSREWPMVKDYETRRVSLIANTIDDRPWVWVWFDDEDAPYKMTACLFNKLFKAIHPQP